MDAFDQLERQLARSVAQRSRSRRRVGRGFATRAWPRRFRSGGALPLLAAAVAIAVVVVALVSLRHSPAPASGGPPPAGTGPLLPSHLSRLQGKELDYIEKSYGSTVRADPACIGNSLRAATVSQGSPSPSLLSMLAVLRRPATPSDKLPRRVVGLDHKVIPNGSLPILKDVYVRYIRRARWRFGAGYYLVPAGNANSRRPLPARCYREQAAALHRELPQIPRALRAGTLALEPRFINQLRQDAKPYEGVCLVALNDTGGGDGCGSGYSIADIEEGHTISSGGPTGVGVVYGLVPDGVATVTLSYSARHKADHSRTITVKAISNVFIVRNPGQRLPNYGFPTSIVWRSATGAVIKTVDRQTP